MHKDAKRGLLVVRHDWQLFLLTCGMPPQEEDSGECFCVRYPAGEMLSSFDIISDGSSLISLAIHDKIFQSKATKAFK